MGQTARHVVLETLAYLGTQNLTDKLPSINTPALAMVGELSEGRHTRPGARAGRLDAQLHFGADPRRGRLRAALGARAVRAGVAGVCGGRHTGRRNGQNQDLPDCGIGRIGIPPES